MTALYLPSEEVHERHDESPGKPVNGRSQPRCGRPADGRTNSDPFDPRRRIARIDPVAPSIMSGRGYKQGMAIGPVGPPASTVRIAVPTGSTRYPCQAVDPDLWFAEIPADVEQAKSLCRECPVRVSCLATALRRAEPWGVWGGELLIHGQVRPHKRGRGRPRKQPAAA